MTELIKTIKKSIAINASKEKVWNILLDDASTRIWYTAFSIGSHAETDWKVGSKVIFTDHTRSGLIGTIVENNPPQNLTVEYQGVLENGIEDYDSELAKSFKGAKENYLLNEKDGLALLTIESNMNESMFDSMSIAWTNALNKIKELAETN